MNENRILRRDLFERLPPEWPDDLLPEIQRKVQDSQRKVFVLDDDPTGTQTMHDVPVLTEWPVDLLLEELNGFAPAVYLLTNTRSMPEGQAEEINREAGDSLYKAGQIGGKGLAVISRSDSTLRGHFPSEVAALEQGLHMNFDAWLIVPFFAEGGRFTVDDIHYVAEGDWLVPAGETEFARDKSFGYHASNLREWVAEKTGGRIQAEAVASISIQDVRVGGPEVVTEKLLTLPEHAICIANAASSRDLEVLVMGVLAAEAAGQRYLYRTAASFVRVRSGIAPRPLLTHADLHLPAESAGLVIVGSYVPRTTAQLDTLLNRVGTAAVEMQVPRLLDSGTRDGEILRVQQDINHLLAEGRDVVLYTSRALVSTEGTEANLAIGQAVSAGLVSVVRGLEIRPRYILAKGGITSSDIATRGLEIRRAMVLGQILPGVPVWLAGSESRFPGMPYIVFPGNVGGPDALVEIVDQLQSNEI